MVLLRWCIVTVEPICCVELTVFTSSSLVCSLVDNDTHSPPFSQITWDIYRQRHFRKLFKLEAIDDHTFYSDCILNGFPIVIPQSHFEHKV